MKESKLLDFSLFKANCETKITTNKDILLQSLSFKNNFFTDESNQSFINDFLNNKNECKNINNNIFLNPFISYDFSEYNDLHFDKAEFEEEEENNNYLLDKFDLNKKSLSCSLEDEFNENLFNNVQINKSKQDGKTENFFTPKNNDKKKISNIIIPPKKTVKNKVALKKREKNTKISKVILFKTLSINFSKSGNIIKRNSQRHQNCKRKIIRNFIQNILIHWISDGIKDKMLNKKDQIIYNYIKYKGKKLREIYSESNNRYNNDIIENSKGNMLIKFNFYFEEAFKAFCFVKLRKGIFFEVKNRVMNELKREIKEVQGEQFYIKLESKNQYIDEKIIYLKDKNLFEESFEQLLSEFNLSEK